VGCTLLSGQPGTYPLSYECRQAAMAVMSSSCTYSGVPDGSCPAHYAFDPATRLCLWNGSRSLGIECPAGEFYDPVAPLPHHHRKHRGFSRLSCRVCRAETMRTPTSVSRQEKPSSPQPY
jgi:hypothetical protein